MKIVKKIISVLFYISILLTISSAGLGWYAYKRMGLHRSLYYHNANILESWVPLIALLCGMVLIIIVIKHWKKCNLLKVSYLVLNTLGILYVYTMTDFLGSGLLLISYIVTVLVYTVQKFIK